MVSFVYLKMSNQIKREKEIEPTVFLFCCKGQGDSKLLWFYRYKQNDTVNV